MSRSDRGGSADNDQIGLPNSGPPLCPRVKLGAGFRHLPRKGGEGEFFKGLREAGTGNQPTNGTSETPSDLGDTQSLALFAETQCAQCLIRALSFSVREADAEGLFGPLLQFDPARGDPGEPAIGIWQTIERKPL